MNLVTISNDNQQFIFTDKWCSSSKTSRINYDIDSVVLFDVIGISFQYDVSMEKRSVEKKKFFKTVVVEVEEEVVRHYILLSYKKRSTDAAAETIHISVLPEEVQKAQEVVDYISALLKKKVELDKERKLAESIRLRELLLAEQSRLAQCIYDVVVIDFETTGLKSPMDGEKYDEILSVSIIDQDGKVLLNSLCKPIRRKTWAKAQEIHGISPSMVKNQPTFEELFPQIKEILYKAKLVLAYNIEFEMQFLWGFDLEYGKPGGTQLIRNVVWGPDPMLMYCAYKGIERWQKLESAASHFKYQYEAHNSLDDVKATLHCYNKLMEYVAKRPDKDYIVKYGYTYEHGIKGKWIDNVTYQIKTDVPVDYPDVYRNK